MLDKQSSCLEKCNQFAISKNGLCLSTKYINNHTKMLWQCERKHTWFAPWNRIFQGSWCKECHYIQQSQRPHKIKDNIKILQEYAINKGGKLISPNDYITAESVLTWECSNLHQWLASWTHIKNRNSWCFKCFHIKCKENMKTNIKILQEYAIEKNGKLISNIYINNITPLLWECSTGHQWLANWSYIKNENYWCPQCISSFKTERLCKKLLEEKLGFEFRKTKFYHGSSRFEWDGYNEEHKLAFEYHGYQHYEFPNVFHKEIEDFMKGQLRDDFKKWYAKENGISLIIIPFSENENLELFINNEIRRLANDGRI